MIINILFKITYIFRFTSENSTLRIRALYRALIDKCYDIEINHVFKKQQVILYGG